tara:strand:+ start:166 stop:387 length:222 start_codon:yes stop_codon:yes gene_type:complete
VGRLKSYVVDAMERLQLSFEEVTKLSLVELDALLEQREQELQQATTDINNKIDEQGWDVDVDEDGPFICIAEN